MRPSWIIETTLCSGTPPSTSVSAPLPQKRTYIQVCVIFRFVFINYSAYFYFIVLPLCHFTPLNCTDFIFAI